MTADPVAAVKRFIECINACPVNGLAELMTDDHELIVFEESPARRRQLGL